MRQTNPDRFTVRVAGGHSMASRKSSKHKRPRKAAARPKKKAAPKKKVAAKKKLLSSPTSRRRSPGAKAVKLLPAAKKQISKKPAFNPRKDSAIQSGSVSYTHLR